MRKAAVYLALLVLGVFSSTIYAFEPNINDRMELDVARAIVQIKERDPGIQKFFDNSAGYAVFPSVGKGGIVVGGAYGRGLVIVNEQVDGYTALSLSLIHI